MVLFGHVRVEALAACALVLTAAASGANVRALTATYFDKHVQGSSRTWLVEFYAPWCAHCKKLLPLFEEAAAVVSTGPGALISMGKVDCEAQPALCDRFGVQSFPQVLYFTGDGSAGGAREYRGPRTAHGFKSFARRMAGPSVSKLDSSVDLDAWARAEGTSGVAFVYVDMGSGGAFDGVYAHAGGYLRDAFALASTTGQDARGTPGLSTHLAPHGWKAAPTASFLARVEAGVEGVEYLTLAELSDPQGAPAQYATSLRAHRKGGERSDPLYGLKAGTLEASLAAWVIHWKFPLVPALGPDNFPSTANNEEGRWVAIAVLDEEEAVATGGNQSTPNAAFLRAIKRLADSRTSSLSPSVRSKFLFGWIDGAKFASFVEQFGLSATDAPRLLVIDAPKKAYWFDPTVNEEDEIDTWLTDIVEGRAPMQRQGIMAMPQRLVNAIGVYGAGGVAVLATLLLAWLVYTLVLAEAIGWNLGARDAAARAAALKRAEQRRAAKAAPRVAYEERADDADLMALASKREKREHERAPREAK